MNVEIYQLPTLPTSLRTSSPTSGGPLAPSGLLLFEKWIVTYKQDWDLASNMNTPLALIDVFIMTLDEVL
jgi:hypothetical protein